jgi:hypothetical protein
LREISHDITLNEILGTEKGIEALTEVLQESDASEKFVKKGTMRIEEETGAGAGR